MTRVLAVLVIVPALTFGNNANRHALDWLVGCWVSPDKSSQEVWVVNNGDSLAGFGVTIRDNAVAFFEVLSIGQADNGVLIYSAHPSGQETASFAATNITANSVLFVNADHDYPQEVRYSREGKQLLATVSLLGGAKPNSFNKIACE